MNSEAGPEEICESEGRIVMFRHILAISASIFMFTAIASAQPRGGMMKAADELGLTDDQIARMDDLMLQHQKDMIGKRAEIKELKLDLMALMRKSKVDEKAAMGLQDKISALKADLAKTQLKHKLAMRNILTAEQLQKWLKMQREFHRGKGMRSQGMEHSRMPHRGMMGPGAGDNPGQGPWD